MSDCLTASGAEHDTASEGPTSCDRTLAVPVKLVAFACMLLCVFLTDHPLWLWLPSLVGLCHLAFQGRWRLVASFTSFYLVLAALLWAIVAQGLRMVLFSEFTVLLFWILFPAMIISWDLMTTPPGLLAEFMSRLHAPTSWILGMLVVFRFFPTMGSELSGIVQSMRNRALLSPLQIVRHPALNCEYVLVPLLLRCLQIADQLTVSAIARCAEQPGVRGSYHSRPLCLGDWAWVTVWIVTATAFLALGGSKL